MKNNKLQMFNLFVTVALAAFIILQFIPFYSWEGENYSIFGFIWWRAFEMKKFGRELYKPFDVNKAVTPIVMSFVLGVASVVMNVSIPDTLGAELMSIAWMIWTTVGFIGNEMLFIKNPTKDAFLVAPALSWVILGLVVITDILIIFRAAFFVPIFKERIEKKAKKYR